jgi:hypothetical protein
MFVRALIAVERPDAADDRLAALAWQGVVGRRVRVRAPAFAADPGVVQTRRKNRKSVRMITGFRGATGTAGVLFMALAALAWLALPLAHPVYTVSYRR